MIEYPLYEGRKFALRKGYGLIGKNPVYDRHDGAQTEYVQERHDTHKDAG